MRVVLLVLISTLLGISVFGQANTVTNADLEKFRQKRLAAERELRENYRELGFASPEERARQQERADRDRSERADKYREQRQIQQQTAFQQQPVQTNLYFPANNAGRTYYPLGIAPAYYYGNSFIPIRRGNRRLIRRGPGYITNPYIRNTWRRQSAPMRRTYRGNFPRKTRP